MECTPNGGGGNWASCSAGTIDGLPVWVWFISDWGAKIFKKTMYFDENRLPVWTGKYSTNPVLSRHPQSDVSFRNLTWARYKLSLSMGQPGGVSVRILLACTKPSVGDCFVIGGINHTNHKTHTNRRLGTG